MAEWRCLPYLLLAFELHADAVDVYLCSKWTRFSSIIIVRHLSIYLSYNPLFFKGVQGGVHSSLPPQALVQGYVRAEEGSREDVKRRLKGPV